MGYLRTRRATISTWLIALIVAVPFGVLSGIVQGYRIKNHLNPYILRHWDGSVVGGYRKVLFWFGLLWIAVGFAVAYGITALVKWAL